MEGVRKILRDAYLGGSRYKVQIVTKSGVRHDGSVTHLGADHVVLYTDYRESDVVLLSEVESARMAA